MSFIDRDWKISQTPQRRGKYDNRILFDGCVAVLVKDVVPRVSERVKEAGRGGRPMIQLVEEAGTHVELVVMEEDGMAVFNITWQASSTDIAHPCL